MRHCRSSVGVLNRKFRGSVARIAHNYVGCEPLIPEVRAYTPTNDNITVTGLDVGDLNSHVALVERETRCKGTVYR